MFFNSTVGLDKPRRSQKVAKGGSHLVPNQKKTGTDPRETAEPTHGTDPRTDPRAPPPDQPGCAEPISIDNNKIQDAFASRYRRLHSPTKAPRVS